MYILDVQWAGSLPILDAGAAARFGGFEMVDLEPTWKRALRLREEAKAEATSRKTRKRAELIEKIAARTALSSAPEAVISARVGDLLKEWIDTAPLIDKIPAAEVPRDRAYEAFLAHVAEQIRRMQDDDEAAAMLLM